MSTRLDPSAAGVWIDGWWGQYGPARLCQIAFEQGWTDEKATELPFQIQSRTTAEMVEQHLGQMELGSTASLSDVECEQLIWASDDAEVWLNTHIAPEGYAFYWEDGDFGLWPVEV